MLEVVKSGAVVGLDAVEVTIEVDVARGMPGFTIVGLPDAAVQESRERVRAAVLNSEYEFQPSRLTVNLAPADLRKAGPAYDLPIAIGFLSASGQINRQSAVSYYWLVGELSLTGEVKPVNGVLSIAAAAHSAGSSGIIVPAENAAEAAIVTGIDVIPVSSLAQAARFLSDDIVIEPAVSGNRSTERGAEQVDFAEIRGQLEARRALEIAAAGGHNVLMVGPPGSGKSMLARRLPTIMPPLSADEAIEVTKIYSLGGQAKHGRGLIWTRPYRAPHHTISAAGLAGGGKQPRPGEITLSHRGVLFLDEMAEFSQSVLQVLRQPIESKIVTISRANGRVTYPADFMLVGAMNPCPCGYLGDRQRECACTVGRIRSYRSKLSGPLLDRIDIHIEVPRLSQAELMGTSTGETSAAIKDRVIKARAAQAARFGSKTVLNGCMSAKQVRQSCSLSESIVSWLARIVERMALSARGYDRVLKVARTIADIAGHESVELVDVAEAIQYRSADRQRAY
ncbi:MAG: YifB family Mg chelatase-like AAA ATPase [Actinomycetota bacterium]|nr:YifB family Mg chelatase-like AAA ATPase [Actinomycetota bacterium]